MSAETPNDELVEVLTSIAEGGDRPRAVERIKTLLTVVSGPPWTRELAYIVKYYDPEDDATNEALMTLAVQAIKRFACPVCGQMVLHEPAWHESGSPSDEICPSCGIQFGYDDADPLTRQAIYEKWRSAWEVNGRKAVRPKPTRDG